MNIFKLVYFVLNPQKAVDFVNKSKSDLYTVGYLNEFFSKYITFGKPKEEVVKINELIDQKKKTNNKLINALIELRKIRDNIKITSKKDQIIKTSKSFGVSSGIVVGEVLNITSTNQIIPKNCICIFPTSGVKFTTQFLKCTGLIFKNGAMTSHGAILAREKGIPALVNPNIDIKDGKTVKINGLSGLVDILN